MVKSSERLQYLLNRYWSGSSNNEEDRELWSYAVDPAYLDQWVSALPDAFDKDRLPKDKGLSAVDKQDILNYIFSQQAESPAPVKINRLWPAIALIAAALAVITLGVWMYFDQPSSRGLATGHLLVNDIAPGTNRATLTLADGKMIVLDTNKTSVTITDSVKTATMITASTPRGGTYQVVLPDGTKAWLNADSRIVFPSQFNGSKRTVSVSGEVYFEVAANKAKPFIVQSTDQQIEVLGTHFNVHAYADGTGIKTTLLEGSLRVTASPAATTAEAIILKPGQQSVVKENKIVVQLADLDEAVAWKNGYFRFNAARLSDIMQQLARWYDIEVHYEGDIAGVNFSARIDRDKNISQVLRMLEKTKGVQFKIEGRRVTAIAYK